MPDDCYSTGKRPRGMNCPVCGVHSERIYARVLDQHGAAHKMTPPRCGACAEAWAQQNVFTKPKSYVIYCRVEPMSAEEIAFLKPYETQMQDVNLSPIQTANER